MQKTNKQKEIIVQNDMKNLTVWESYGIFVL